MIPGKVLNRFLKIFSEVASIRKVYLFGSRARGDYKPRSDIDLAIEGERLPVGIKTRLRHVSGLYKLDIVYLSEEDIEQDLLREIENEGIVIYDSESSASIAI